MAVVGTAEVLVTPTFTGMQAATQKAAKQLGGGLTSSSAQAGKDAGDKAGKSFGGSLKGHAVAAGGVLAGAFAVDKVVDFFKDANAEARESQKVGARTANVIKSTGGAAKITATQVGDLATALSNKTGIDDEAIQSGANMLLTFKNIRNEAGKNNDMFNQTTSIVTDMSAAMGMDMKSAALQVGKALNDPANGLSKLTRVGVAFTEQQKAQVKALQLGGDANAAVATGLLGSTQEYSLALKRNKNDAGATYKDITKDLTKAQKKQFDYYAMGGHDMAAQKILLKELKSEFGGAAAAQSTMGEKVATSFANFKESVGTALLPVVDALLGKLNKALPVVTDFVSEAGPKFASGLKQATPVLKIVGSAISKAFGFIVDHGQATTLLVGGITAAMIGWKTATLAASVATKTMAAAQGIAKIAMGAATVATKAFAAGQWLVNAALSANPIGLVVIAIAALVAGFVIAYKKSDTFRKIVNGALSGVKNVALAVVKWFKTDFVDFFTKKIPAAFGAVVSWVKKNWVVILGILTAPIGGAVLIIFKYRKQILDALKGAWTWVKGTFKGLWSGAKGIMLAPVAAARDAISDAWKKVTGKFSDAKKWVSGTWKAGWSNAKSWMSDSVKSGRDKIGDAWTTARGKFSSARDWVKGTWKSGWSNAKSWMSDSVKSGKDKIGDAWKDARGKFSAAGDWVKGAWKQKWSNVKTFLADPVGEGKKRIGEILGKTGLRSVFSSAVTAIGTIWDKIKNVLAKPIKWVVDNVINKVLIAGINKIGNFVGLGGKDKKILSPISTKGLARGGRVPGYTPVSRGDDVVMPMRRGEGVYVSEAMRDPYEQARMHAVNHAALSGRSLGRFRDVGIGAGLAFGGMVSGMGGGGISGKLHGGSGRFSSLATTTLLQAQQLAGTMFSIFQRGFRPATSYSGTSHQGDAIDTGPVTPGVVSALRRVGWAAWDRTGKGNWAPHIHAVPLSGAGYPAGSAVWQGQDYLNGGDGLGGTDNGPRGFLSGILSKLKKAGGTAAGFFKGIGAKIAGTAGALLDPSSLLTKAVTTALGTAKDVFASPFGQIVSKVPGKLGSMALDWAKGKLGALNPFSGGDSSVSGGGQEYVRSQMLKKWPESEWPALKKLVDNESGWRLNATNPSSGAYGWFQAWPASKLDAYGNRNSQEAQTKFGLSYINSAYGSPSNALAKWNSRDPHWYDDGGMLPTGTSLVHNGTGKPERVLTDPQWDALAAGNQKIEITLRVEGTGRISDREAGMIADALEQRIRTRKGVVHGRRTG